MATAYGVSAEKFLLRRRRKLDSAHIADSYGCASRRTSTKNSGDELRRAAASPRSPITKRQMTNQLIVGPPRWAYQVLGATLGERFMDNREARISIDRFFIQVIYVGAIRRTGNCLRSFFRTRVITLFTGVAKQKIFRDPAVPPKSSSVTDGPAQVMKRVAKIFSITIMPIPCCRAHSAVTG